MAVNKAGRGKSLAATIVGGATVTITKLKRYATSRDPQLADFKEGDADVAGHYLGDTQGYIEIETSDIANAILLPKGTKVESVDLRVNAAKDTAGTAVGDELTFPMTKGVVTSAQELSHDDANHAPGTMVIRIDLSKHPGETSDPTIGPWAAVTP